MCLKVQKYLKIANLARKSTYFERSQRGKLAETVLEPQICVSYFRGVTSSRGRVQKGGGGGTELNA